MTMTLRMANGRGWPGSPQRVVDGAHAALRQIPASDALMRSVGVVGRWLWEEWPPTLQVDYLLMLERFARATHPGQVLSWSSRWYAHPDWDLYAVYVEVAEAL